MSQEKYFDSQQDDEEIIYLLRRHWLTIFPALFGTVIIYLIGFVGLFVLPHIYPGVTEGFLFNFYVLLLSLIFLFGTGCIYALLVIYYLNVALVTNEHIVDIVQERFFVRNISELQLGKIQDVAAKQKGIFQGFFNYGTVEIETAGELPNFIFEKIPRPGEMAQEIMKLQEKYRKNMGISKEEAESLSDLPIYKNDKDDKIESSKKKS